MKAQKQKQQRAGNTREVGWEGFDEMLGIGGHSEDRRGRSYNERAGRNLQGRDGSNTELFSRAQGMLRNLGLFRGRPTGSDTQKFRDAIREFQEMEGLEPTGVLNEETSQRLARAAR